MSWTDKQSIKHIKQLRDQFFIRTFIETGTHKGMNCQVHTDNFREVLSCELNKEYYDYSVIKLKDHYNVHLFNMDSAEFLADFVKRYKRKGRGDTIFIYLDAHFYDPDLPKEERFVVLRELKALKDIKCIICIHDFDNNLGHITYDGQPLNLELIKKDLMKVNPRFKLYTNELSSCDIMTTHEAQDQDQLENLEYAWSNPRLTYRGILYAIPEEVEINGLRPIK